MRDTAPAETARHGRVAAVRVINVQHESKVSAIQSAAGPRRILDAGLVEALEAAGAATDVVDVHAPEDALGEVDAAFDVASRVAREVRAADEAGRLALVLSGSCHVGLGSVSGVAGQRRGVVWLDAHGDFNTPETTTSGLVDATALASITGRCWARMCDGVEGFSPVADENVLLVGVRALDGPEADLVDASEITVIAADEMAARAPAALAALGDRTDGVYVHIDLDVLDPSVGRANAWAAEGGLSVADLAGLLTTAFGSCRVAALGFASYDPSADPEGRVAEAAVELVRTLAETSGRPQPPKSP